MQSVGLTGNIASGKSTVAGLLRDRHGFPVIDADAVAREVVRPGTPALEAIRKAFGAQVIRADGRLDRDALGAIIRTEPRQRRTLEAITHPAIHQVIEAWLEDQQSRGANQAIVEAALLVETGQQQRYDLLLVVSCSPDIQVQRLMARNDLTREQALGWLSTQLPAAAKEQHADLVIHNDGTPPELEQAVAQAAAWLISRR